jgi:hypothetical protein
MVWAWGNNTEATIATGSDTSMVYHGATISSRSTWTLTINKDGSASSSGDNGITGGSSGPTA